MGAQDRLEQLVNLDPLDLLAEQVRRALQDNGDKTETQELQDSPDYQDRMVGQVHLDSQV